MSEPSSNRRLRNVLVAVAALLFMVATGVYQWRHLSRMDEPPPSVLPAVQIGGPFRLIDHAGRSVSDADYQGKYLLVFFGYTFCPDVCPTELTVIAEALDLLGPLAEPIQPLFVSVDPARDTPAVLAEYVRQFHPRIVGLTGGLDDIAQMARSYRAFFAKSEATKDSPDYLIDHSALAYLMGPDGKFVTTFAYNTTAEKMAAGLRKFLGGEGSSPR